MTPNKEFKHTLKKVDSVLEKIKSDIPEDFNPAQINAIFQLYISMYE